MIFAITQINFFYVPQIEPADNNSSVIYFGANFIFENNIQNTGSFFAQDINCFGVYLGNIFYFKGDFYFNEEIATDGSKTIFFKHIVNIKYN